MGYRVEAYLVHLDKLRAAYGSQDLSILQDMEVKLQTEMNEIDEWTEGEWDVPAPPIRDVLMANIKGQFPWKYEESPYKAALQLFCKYFGNALPTTMFEWLRPLGVRFIEEEDIHLRRLVFKSSSPVDIPGIEEEDMYCVGHITSEQAAEMLLERERPSEKDIDCDDPNNWEECARRQFYGWLVAAKETGQGIVTFFY
jgi:hypothetical protein